MGIGRESTKIEITSTTQETYQDTGLTATITPSSVSSKILVIADIGNANVNDLASGVFLCITRNSTVLVEFAKYIMYNAEGGNNAGGNYLDSPSTTSATTYKVQFKRGTGTATVYANDNNSVSTMTLMEIAG